MDHGRFNFGLLKKVSILLFISWLSEIIFGNGGSTLIIFSTIVIFRKLLNLWNCADKGENIEQRRERIVKEKTGYKFKNPDLLHQAFTHPSVPQNWPSNDRMEYLTHPSDRQKRPSNDRMEYLGDAVLNQLIAKEHYFAYPDSSSGDLTRLRSVNVDTEKLARVAIEHNLHDLLDNQIHLFKEQVEAFRNATLEYPLHSLGFINNPPKVLADIVEALISAIYIDSNFSMDITWQAVKDLLQPLITPETLKTLPVKILTKLCQKNKLELDLVDNWEETGEMEYFVDRKFAGKGKFSGDKDTAKNMAASNACDKLKKSVYS